MTEEQKQKKKESAKRYYDNNKDKIKLYYVEHRERLIKYNSEQYYLNRERALVQGAKKRAKERNLEFDISSEDIKIPDVCPILGTKLDLSPGSSLESSPTIDRIDSNKGYTKDNIQVISHRANTLKNNATIEELEKVLSFLKDYS